MYLRKHAKLVSMAVLFCLLAGYSRSYLKVTGKEFLFAVWNCTFRRFGPDCIYWIAMRLAAWISVYLHLLRLDNGFSVYLFLRQKSFGKVFMRTYGACMGMALCYYGAGTVIIAVCHGATLPGADVGCLLWQTGLPLILAEEGLEALSFCLGAYALHCVFRNATAGFLAVLAGRILLNFATGGARPALFFQIAANLALTGIVFLTAFHDFTEKFADR